MKIYFWDGHEFNGTAPPGCEIHILGKRIKLMTMGKFRTTRFYMEEL